MVDLARDRSALGQLEKAEELLRQALLIAPDNRFVLRAASRFFLHTRRPDDAHRVLQRASGTPHDPWLLSAEIVASSAAKRSSRLIKIGAAMVDAATFAPYHTAELASAIGTLEHLHGNRRKVRRYFAHAMIDPTENAVAQASWIARHTGDPALADLDLKVPRAFEAGAWEAAIDDRVDDALAMAWQWLRDEPFATRAALFGSWTALTADDNCEVARQMVLEALTANPNDPRLVAQLVYCLACLGELDEAERLLPRLIVLARRYPDIASSEDVEVVVAADRGLIAFRRGHIEEGRTHYTRAVEKAKELGRRQLQTVAALNFIREEIRANPLEEIPRRELAEAVETFDEPVRPFYRRFVERIIRMPRVVMR